MYSRKRSQVATTGYLDLLSTHKCPEIQTTVTAAITIPRNACRCNCSLATSSQQQTQVIFTQFIIMRLVFSKPRVHAPLLINPENDSRYSSPNPVPTAGARSGRSSPVNDVLVNTWILYLSHQHTLSDHNHAKKAYY